MANKRDYYEVLGVGKSASADELKAAYRKFAMKWHPDRWVNGTDAEKKTAEANFKEASEAYAVLSDPQKRAQYDRFGFAGDQGPAADSAVLAASTSAVSAAAADSVSTSTTSSTTSSAADPAASPAPVAARTSRSRSR